MARLEPVGVDGLSPWEAFERRLCYIERSPLVEMLERRCLEDSVVAYLLLRHVHDLPVDIRREAELKAREDHRCTTILVWG